MAALIDVGKELFYIVGIDGKHGKYQYFIICSFFLLIFEIVLILFVMFDIIILPTNGGCDCCFVLPKSIANKFFR